LVEDLAMLEAIVELAEEAWVESLVAVADLPPVPVVVARVDRIMSRPVSKSWWQLCHAFYFIVDLYKRKL
jgi:hypothetical protein